VLAAVNENFASSFDAWIEVHFPSFDITKSYKTLNITLCKADYMRCDVPTEVVMKSYVFWGIMSGSPLKVNRRFGGTCRLHIQGLKINQAKNQALLATYFHTGFLLGLFFEPEIEAADFQRTTVLYLRK
jgi:hypothetical protein